jgi:DNA-binding transcriptional regulator LsrR (DeoR family)
VTSKAALAARAAWLQLIDNRTNIEIAGALGISRLRVPKLVRWAEDHDVAEISIHPPAGLDWSTAERLHSEYGIVDALVSPQPALHPVARLAARYICEVLIEGGALGVTWGRGAQAMVSELEQMPNVPQTDVVQLIGGLPEPDTAWHSAELLVRLSAVLGGSAAALLSPMIVPDAATAHGLREEPSIAHAFAAMARLDVAVLGIGAWVPDGSRVRAELAPDDLARTEDIVADVCGILLDVDGNTVHHELSRRILSIEEPTLRSRPVRVGIAIGDSKVAAIRAALRSGLLTVLCTDTRTAELVLDAS